MKRWKPARTLYLVLAIMLTFSVIPFIPFSINMTLARQGTLSLFDILFLMYDVIGLLVALTLLGRVRRDHYKPIGALLGFVTYALALVGHFLFYRYREETLYFSDFFQAPVADEIFRVIVIVAVVTWIFNVLALIMCYVEVFNLRERMRTRRQASAHKTASSTTRQVASTRRADHKRSAHEQGIVADGQTGEVHTKKATKSHSHKGKSELEQSRHERTQVSKRGQRARHPREDEQTATDKTAEYEQDEDERQTITSHHQAAEARDAVQRKKLEESRAIAAERKAEAQAESQREREQSLAEVEERRSKKEAAARLRVEKAEAKRLKQEQAAEKKRLTAERKAERARRKRERQGVELLAADEAATGYKNIAPIMAGSATLATGDIEKRGKRRKKAEQAKDYKNINASAHVGDEAATHEKAKRRKTHHDEDEQIHIHLDGSSEPYATHEAERQVHLRAEDTNHRKARAVDYAEPDDSVDLIIEGVNLSQIGLSGDEATIEHVRDEIRAQDEQSAQRPQRARRNRKQKVEDSQRLDATMYDDVPRGAAFDDTAEDDYVAQVTDELLLHDDERLAQAKAEKIKKRQTKRRSGGKKDDKAPRITADMLDPTDWDDE
jgi:hypothetical protein